MNKLISRLAEIGYHLELISNLPWIYVHKINGKLVTEKFLSDYGYTIAIYTNEGKMEINLEVFKLLKKYKK